MTVKSSISLTDEQDTFARALVEKGRYGSLSAVLQQGLDYDLALLGRLAFSARALQEAEQLLFRFQRFHIGLELRSERFLVDCFGPPLPPGRG